MSSPFEMPTVPSKSLGLELSHRRRRRQRWPVMAKVRRIGGGERKDRNAATRARLHTRTQHAHTQAHTLTRRTRTPAEAEQSASVSL